MICSKDLLIILTFVLLIFYVNNSKLQEKVRKIVKKVKPDKIYQESNIVEQESVIIDEEKHEFNKHIDINIMANKKRIKKEINIIPLPRNDNHEEIKEDENIKDSDDEIFKYVESEESEINIPNLLDQIEESDDEIMEAEETEEDEETEETIEKVAKNKFEIKQKPKENSEIKRKYNFPKIDINKQMQQYQTADWKSLKNAPLFDKCNFTENVPSVLFNEDSALHVTPNKADDDLQIGDNSFYGTNKYVNKDTQDRLNVMNKKLIKSGAYQFPEYTDRKEMEEANNANALLSQPLINTIKSKINTAAKNNSSLRDTFNSILVDYKGSQNPEDKTKLVTSNLVEQTDQAEYSYISQEVDKKDNIGNNEFGSFSDFNTDYSSF